MLQKAEDPPGALPGTQSGSLVIGGDRLPHGTKIPGEDILKVFIIINHRTRLIVLCPASVNTDIFSFLSCPMTDLLFVEFH